MAAVRKAIFISDTHICGRHDAAEESVRRFIHEVVAPDAANTDLYLLGDVFEFWFEYSELVLAYPFRFLASLRLCIDAGARVYFLPGNRDFAFGRFLKEEVGAQVCRDVEDISLGGRRVLLTHGDLLCTRDRSYQRWRWFLRSPVARAAFDLVPTFLCGALCRQLVRTTRRHAQRKEMDLFADVLDSATEYVRQGYDVVVCGHLHRALHRPILVEGRAGDLYTLSSWMEGDIGAYLVWDGAELQLKRFHEAGVEE
jgi:UDP-2,3-diacylglucosamine hydrolase